ncbi:4-(cytidine 5'-diphospho)-2-C-methyl-D-erythritol kinase [Taibaiella lutea]|uniref:4-diphosphocytidyl-2-C-methyl-D-erythritol kinase n=1 Tax=Taibaiella lutea TaxID=2608001 RepID=A0A5M6CST8_9BACT|nr:4-(cytidine 5'-diphospho)-2-C-methyl-D-erythritol kinase [Taibaiella lutea]KAA5537450.1 4-(cytidine 5'-diphospho)-2-C-methyl-D-erythritol kinase [Taibaiella lutea]
MLRFPNAKINIGLSITGKREDGYHNLETVFYPVEVKDALEIIASEETNMHLSGFPVEGSSDNNLVWKAYQVLERDFPELVKPLEIYLHKAIPMGAGLGGGSADGAFMLSMLNDFFGLNIPSDKLESYALQLGSDCPFFIRNKPVFAKGRGEIMEPVPLSLDNYSIQLICPKLHISTANAFKGIVPKTASFNLNAIEASDIKDWKSYIINDFERTLFPHYPVLQQIKHQLYEQGAIYASLSGTGATVYGIFEKGKRAEIQSDIQFDEFSER